MEDGRKSVQRAGWIGCIEWESKITGEFLSSEVREMV